MPGSPIFVVGASRSGTSLIRSILNQHSEIHLAGETHYFDDLRPRFQSATASALSDEQRTRVEDYFMALAHRPYGHGGNASESSLPRERLRTRAIQLGDDMDAYFAAFCQLMTDDKGKSDGRWGEKTPRHVFRIPDMLNSYPDAQIVCAVRDPRAVVSSYRDWQHQGGFDLDDDPGHRAALAVEHERTGRSYDLRLATLLWRSTVGASQSARERFGSARVRIQRYEDLVKEPEACARDLATWLGLDFEPEMMDVPIHNSSFTRFDAHGGVSSDSVRRWESRLSGREIATIEFLGGKVMRSQGYAPTNVSTSRLSTVASMASLPAAIVRAAMTNRDRIGSLPTYVWRRARAVVSLRS